MIIVKIIVTSISLFIKASSKICLKICQNYLNLFFIQITNFKIAVSGNFFCNRKKETKNAKTTKKYAFKEKIFVISII